MDLNDFVEALGSQRRQPRDECGDRRIEGKAGWIYAEPEGFYLYCRPGSARGWGYAKKAMDFCRVTQDGDEEGVLLLDRLPSPAEAEIIRDKLWIRKRREMTEASLQALEAAREKSPLQLAKGSRRDQPRE